MKSFLDVYIVGRKEREKKPLLIPQVTGKETASGSIEIWSGNEKQLLFPLGIILTVRAILISSFIVPVADALGSSSRTGT